MTFHSTCVMGILMSYPFNNPDVDPLSQNQRIRALEDRPPSGGGAAGGGPYTIPNFDLYPDNAIKFYPDVGVVGKITILPSPQVIPNVELRYCFYRPVFSGGPFGPTFFFIRAYNSSSWSISTTPNISNTIYLNQEIDCEDYFQAYVEQTRFKYAAVLNTASNLPYTISGVSTTLTFYLDLAIAPPSSPGGARSYVSTRTYFSSSQKPPVYLAMPAGYRFLYAVRQMDGNQPLYIHMPAQSFIYSTVESSYTPTVTVTNLQDLSSAYKSLYPQSWTT